MNELEEKPTEQRGSTADHRERHTGDEPAAAAATEGKAWWGGEEGKSTKIMKSFALELAKTKCLEN